MAQATNSTTYESSNDEPQKDSEREDEELYKEFTSEKDLSEDEKSKLVEKLDKMFRYALDHPSWQRGREKMIQCFKYREGEQWTSEELKELQDRGQPDTVNNQISVVVNKLVGDLINQRFRVGYRGRNAADAVIGELLTDIFLYVRQNNDLEFEERDMADDGFTCGMGVLDVSVSFDDMLQPEIKARCEDPLIVFPDPDGRAYDWNEDCKFVARAKWWSLDEAVEKYPQAELDLNGAMGSSIALGEDAGHGQLGDVDQFKGENYVDKDNERVRIIEVQYKKYEREQILIVQGGRSIPFSDKKEIMPILKQCKEQGLECRIVDRLNYKICVGVYAAGILLEHKLTDHRYYSLVPYFAYRRKTGEPFSLITLALSMQDAINKRESKALHLLNTNRAIYERRAVSDKTNLAEEKAKPDGMIELEEGALTNQRFQLQENLELASSQFQMHTRAQEDLYKIVGIDPRLGQQTGELRSGAGLQRKYAEGSKPVATLFDNIRRTRKIFARVVLDRVQQYFTPEKTMLITDDDKKSRLVGLTAPIMERIKNAQYDVVVDEFDDDPTTQDEQFRVFAETLPQILQFPPQYTKMLVEMSRIRNKQQVLEIIDSQNGPPPLAPKMNLQANLDNLEAVERAGVWELVGRKDIADFIRANPPMTTNEMKLTGDLQKEQMKSDKPADREKIALEMEQSKLEHGMKLTEMSAKHEVDMSKHQLDMQKSMMKIAESQAKPEKKETAKGA